MRLAVLGIACVLTFDALYVLNHTFLRRFTTNDSVEAFDLDAEGSLATWFNTVLLFLCAQVTLLLWHSLGSTGDSRGTSRHVTGPSRAGLLFTSMVWFTMSADEGGSLHEGFKEMMVLVLGTRLYGDGSVYWIVPYFAVLAATGIFLLRQMGRTVAGGLLVAAGGLWALAVVSHLELLFSQPMVGILVEESCEMLGTLCLLGSLCLFAQQTLDARRQGAGAETDGGAPQ